MMRNVTIECDLAMQSIVVNILRGNSYNKADVYLDRIVFSAYELEALRNHTERERIIDSVIYQRTGIHLQLYFISAISMLAWMAHDPTRGTSDEFTATHA